MKFWAHTSRSFLIVLALAVLTSISGLSQTDARPRPVTATIEKPAGISRVKVILTENSPAVEITSTRPVVPEIKKEDDPLRLIITLPNSNISVPTKTIAVNSKEISAIDLDRKLALHLSSIQISPATVRIVVHLLEPCSYTWDAAGNRLMVRLHPESKEVAAKPESVPTLTSVEQPLAVPLVAAGSPKIVLANAVPSGASIKASKQPVILRLARGGEIHVCPGTSVVLTRAADGPDMMVGMGTGALETHYALESTSDSILTPDFRILLRGPGEFHYAVSADSRGNTCVRDLPGNTAPAAVSELMGDGVYNLKLGEAVVFHSGLVNTADDKLPDSCGCPATPRPEAAVQLASAAPENAPLPSLNPPQTAEPIKPLASEPVSHAAAETARMSAGPTVATPAKKTENLSLELGSPLVYRATPAPPPPAPKVETQNLPLAYSGVPQPPPAQAAPPTPAANTLEKKPRHGFFGKIKGFMASIFR
jgi:hypothetical protein